MKNIALIFIMMFLVLGVSSQSDTTSSLKKNPTLYGHSFPSLIHFKSSFTKTNVYTGIGMGTTSLLNYSDVHVGDFTIDGFQGKILFITAEIQYQQRVNSWLAMYLSFSLAGRLGSDMSTMLVHGINTLAGGDLGWMIKIKQSKKFNLSASVNVRNFAGSFINVKQFFEDVINSVPNPGIVKNVPAMTGGLGLHGAFAFNDMFGLQASAQMQYGESFKREENQDYYNFGIVGDVDFMPRQNAPVGLALGYTLTSSPQIMMTNDGYANIFMWKIAYTGSDDFELGIQYTFYKIEIDGQENPPSVNSAMFLLKFYF